MLASFPVFPALLARAKSAETSPEPKKAGKPGNEANQTYI